MIRNVVVGRVRPGTELSVIQEALDAIVALPVEGLLDVRVGLDAGLRPGAWSFAITSDFVDAEAYRVYDAEAEHNRIRREQFDPVCEEIARVQFEVKDPLPPAARERTPSSHPSQARGGTRDGAGPVQGSRPQPGRASSGSPT